MTLTASLASAMPTYEIPLDDLVGEVLIPAMQCARDVRIGAGYFSSKCLAQIAPGLAELLKGDGALHLLASTELSPEDLGGIERGTMSPEAAIGAFAVELGSHHITLCGGTGGELAQLLHVLLRDDAFGKDRLTALEVASSQFGLGRRATQIGRQLPNGGGIDAVVQYQQYLAGANPFVEVRQQLTHRARNLGAHID